MKWLLLGSSNIFNHKDIFLTDETTTRRERSVEKCTTLMKFKLEVEKAGTNFDRITIAGLDIVLNELKLAAGAEYPLAVKKGLMDLFSDLNARRQAGVKISVGSLIYWSSFGDEFKKYASDVLNEIRSKFPNILFIPRPAGLRLSVDGIHLVPKSGAKYLEHLIEESLKAWLEVPDDDMEEEVADMSQEILQDVFTPGPLAKTGKGKKRARREPEVKSEDPEMSLLKRRVSLIEQRQVRDLYFFAKHEEALDTVRNEKNLNKIIFSGVNIDKLEGNMDVRKPIIIEALAKIMKEFLPEETAQPEVKYVVHLNSRFKTAWRVIEARFGTAAEAKMIRECFGKKMKDWRLTKLIPDAIKGVGLNMCHTRETRIRIEIMKALAKWVVENSSNTEAYVLQFLARPLLKMTIKNEDESRFVRSFGFTEAVQFLTEEKNCILRDHPDLAEAYRVAGSMKDLEHKFIVLKSGSSLIKDLLVGDSQEEDEPIDKRLKK